MAKTLKYQFPLLFKSLFVRPNFCFHSFAYMFLFTTYWTEEQIMMQFLQQKMSW